MATEIRREKGIENDQKDPVCGMPVSSSKAFKATEQGKDYYFCSKSCREKFQSDPEAYLSPELD